MRASILCLVMLFTFWSAEVHAEPPGKVHDCWFEDDPHNYVLNGQVLGSGEQAIRKIIDHAKTLPAGTSVVWGPDYKRCQDCNDEPLTVDTNPQLWKEFQDVIRERGLHLSAFYPEPYVRFARMPPSFVATAVVSKPPGGGKKFDADLRWDRGLFHGEKQLYPQPFAELIQGLSVGSQVLVRYEPSTKKNGFGEPIRCPHVCVHVYREFCEEARGKRLELTFLVPETEKEDVEKALALEPQRTIIAWTNYRGPTTPEDEVIYTINGNFVGRGDAGFDRILTHVKRLPPKTYVSWPQYFLRGRYVNEKYTGEQLDKINDQLARSLPFATRKTELDRLIMAGELIAEPEDQRVSDLPQSIFDWNSNDDTSLCAFGRIVYYDEQPREAAARLDWNRIDNQPLTYFLNGEPQGRGFAGLVKIMQHLETLPAGSVVHVPVCIRTRPPFFCPIIFENQRHFELTGHEPYNGIYPWLVHVCRERGLQLEWIPDEGKTIQACENSK